MLSYLLALVVASGSFALYMAAFFFPEVHRKNDFVWSGVGLFYALVLWVCAERITGGVLLGQTAGVVLLGWLGWQTFLLRRQVAPVDQQTPLPTAEELKGALSDLTKPENLSKLSGQAARQFDTLKHQAQELVEKAAKPKEAPVKQPDEPYVPLTPADFGPTGRLKETDTPIAEIAEEVAASKVERKSPSVGKTTSPIASVKEKATSVFGIVTDLTKGFSKKKEPKPTYVRKQFRTAEKDESATPTAKLVDMPEPTIVAAELIDADVMPAAVEEMVETTVELVSDAPIEPVVEEVPAVEDSSVMEDSFITEPPVAETTASHSTVFDELAEDELAEDELAETLPTDELKSVEALEFDIPEPVAGEAEIDDWLADKPTGSDEIEVADLFANTPESPVVSEVGDRFGDEPVTSEVNADNYASIDATETSEIPEIRDWFGEETEDSATPNDNLFVDETDIFPVSEVGGLFESEATGSDTVEIANLFADETPAGESEIVATEFNDESDAAEIANLFADETPADESEIVATELNLESTVEVDESVEVDEPIDEPITDLLLDESEETVVSVPEELGTTVTEPLADTAELDEALDDAAVELTLSENVLVDPDLTLTTDLDLPDAMVIEEPGAESDILSPETLPLPVDELEIDDFEISDELSAAISDLPPLDAPAIELESLPTELPPTTAPDLADFSLSDEPAIDLVIPSFDETSNAGEELDLSSHELPFPDTAGFEPASEFHDLNLPETQIADEPAMDLGALSFELDDSTESDKMGAIAGLDDLLEDMSIPTAVFDASDLGELFVEESETEVSTQTIEEHHAAIIKENASEAVQYIDLNNLDLSSLDDSLFESAVEETSLDVESILNKTTKESVDISFDMFGDLGDESTTLNSIPAVGKETQTELDSDSNKV